MQYTIINKSRKLPIIGQNFIILLCIIFVLTVSAQAAQKSKGSKKGPKPIGLVHSSNGGVFKKGQYGIISKYIQYTQDQLYDGNDKVDFERPKKGKKCYEKSFLRYQLTLRTGLELNGQLKNKAKLEGTKKDNTGGHMLYLTPGVHFKFHKGMHLDLCTPIPVLSRSKR